MNIYSGLCGGQGKTWPKGARVTELTWIVSGLASGAMAWSTLNPPQSVLKDDDRRERRTLPRVHALASAADPVRA
jgi:hypothetical protein